MAPFFSADFLVERRIRSRSTLLSFFLSAAAAAGLPDGLFSNQKSKFGKNLEGLAMEHVGIFYGHLVHFTVFCYILWTFGMYSSWGFGIFFPVLVFCTEINLASLRRSLHAKVFLASNFRGVKNVFCAYVCTL
jgi:hypothetical protein